MSQHTVVQVPAFDSLPLYTRIWRPEGHPVAALVVAHGLAEHGARYREFAEAMAGAGVATYVPDLRGHGLTARTVEDLGIFAEQDGWVKAVGDVGTLVHAVRAANTGLPVFLMGHSMGSMLARCYAIDYSNDIAGLILSGTFKDQGVVGRLGTCLARTMARVRGPRHVSRVLKALSYGSYNRAFTPARTEFDWLSRDAAQVDRYIADPLCGFTPSVTLMADVLRGTRQASDPHQVQRMRPDLPTLIASGSADPLAVGVEDVHELFKRAGIFNTTLQLYLGARHEILNETNRDEVVADVVGWLLAHLP